MIKILEELKDLIPPLSTDEKAQLEKNCIEQGIRDPLVLAEYPDENAEMQTVLADGHNRYGIAQDNGLAYKTVTNQFESLDAVKLWMIDNQKGRRNLSDWVKLELAQVKRDILAAKGKTKQGTRTDLLSTIDKMLPEPKHNTRKEIAKDLGWSTGKVAMADKVRKHIETNQDQELRDKLRKNEVSINQAYQELKEKEREAKIAERQQLIEAKKAEPINSNKEWKSVSDEVKAVKAEPLFQAKTEKEIIEEAKRLKEERKQAYKEKMQNRIEEKAKEPLSKEEAEILEKLKAGETVVININKHFAVLKYAKDNDLYQQIDRYSEWGNPFHLNSDGDRDHVCDAYARYYQDKKSLHPKIKTLKGKALGCHCHPLKCHGDELKKLADNED